MGRPVTMDDAPLSLRVQAVPPNERFVWVILERPTPDAVVEITTSLWTYDNPSQAYLAGRRVLLQALGAEPAPRRHVTTAKA
ncbi:hypothetical protein VVAX_06733 [Variovorax paradoxus]|uniref:Uncharacterized protein n=1 Tax=Variovorax paradoxus TaxID=34073 RepID=A0A679JIU4_VARPD|nr:hypothetical protein VVAX_06733 [Variovorax paradoxus]